jgi:tetratricopeptide (TPR) repeat protein
MFTWYHGKPGKDEWRKIEKFFIPINLVLAAFVSFFVFPTGSMAAETQTIVVTNEVGDTLTREVPTLKYQQRFAIFPFDLEDLEDDWLRHVIPTLLEIKLEQDMRVNAVASLSFLDDIKGYGYQTENDENIPANIYRTISSDSYCDFYLKGQISKIEDTYKVTFQLHDSRTGKEKSSSEFTGDLYSITDQIHDFVRESVLLKDFRTSDDEYIDLPAEFLISSKPEALEAYMKGALEMSLNVNSPLGLQLLDQSIKLDDKCALCLTSFGRYAMAQYGVGFKQQYLEKALPLANGLTERQQLAIKFIYYFPNDIAKAEALCEMWRTLYPMDVKPYQHLILIKKVTKQFDDASRIGEEAIAQGHGGKMYLDVAGLATARGKFEESRKYLQEFAKQYPKKATTANEVGMGYAFDGQREKAIDFFNNKIVMDPSNVNNYVQLGIVHLLMGDSEKQWNTLQDGLSKAKGARDSIALYSAMEMNLENQGLIEASFELREKRRAIGKKILPPISFAFDDILPTTVGRYAKVGKFEEAKKGSQSFVTTFENDQYNYQCIADVNYYLAIEDGPGLQKSIDECKDFLLAVDGPQTVELAQGVADLANGKYETSIQHIEKFCEMSGFPSYNMAIYLAKAYRLSGKLSEAEELLNQALKYSAVVPEYLFELAKIYKDQGSLKKAQEFADNAMAYWSKADPDFIPKKELETFISELTQ